MNYQKRKTIRLLEKYWDDLAPVRYLLTLEGCLDKEQDFFRAMKTLGLSDRFFSVIRSKKINGGYWKVCKDIYDTHWKATEEAYRNHGDCSVAIFEDDCRPLLSTDKDSEASEYRLLEAFRYIRSLPKQDWQILNLGAVSLGPIFKIDGVPLVHASIPCCSQAYIINGYYLGNMLKKISRKHWSAPWAVEGFLNIPFKRKYALFPNVTRQCIQPRGLKACFGSKVSFHNLATGSHNIMLYLPWILLLIVILGVYVTVIIWLTHKKPKKANLKK